MRLWLRREVTISEKQNDFLRKSTRIAMFAWRVGRVYGRSDRTALCHCGFRETVR